MAGLDALRSLTSGSGGYLDMRQLQQKRLAEMQRNRELNPKGSGATASDISELEKTLFNDPMMGADAQARTGEIEEQNQAFQDYDRPEAAAIREEQKQNALQKLLAPIQMRGEYAVKAAEAGNQGRQDIAAQNIAGRANVAGIQQAGAAGRNQNTVSGQDRRARIKQLLDAQKKGYSWWSGDAQKSADEAELAKLLAESDNEPEAGAAMPTMGQPETAAQKLRRFSQQ